MLRVGMAALCLPLEASRWSGCASLAVGMPSAWSGKQPGSFCSTCLSFCLNLSFNSLIRLLNIAYCLPPIAYCLLPIALARSGMTFFVFVQQHDLQTG
jgi:hypothetical protein